MKLDETFLKQIKNAVMQAEPHARVILYGSYARGDANEESDIDLLILVDKEKMNVDDRINITDPLFSLGFKTGFIFSPLVQTKKNWEANYFFTPLFHNIQKEGKEI